MPIETEERARTQTEGVRGGDPVPPMRADDHSDAHPATETPVEARQGFLGRPVLIVLVAALALTVVAWAFVHMVAS